jgi:hypothetical protein
VRAASGGVYSLALGPVGSGLLYAGCGDGSIVMFQEQEREYLELHQTQVQGCVTSLSPSADGSEIAVGTQEGNMYRLRASTFESLLIAENHSQAVTNVAFCRGNSECFATCSEDGTIRIWDSGAYTVIAKSFVRGATPTCLAFTDEVIMSGWSDGKIRYVCLPNPDERNQENSHGHVYCRDTLDGLLLCFWLTHARTHSLQLPSHLRRLIPSQIVRHEHRRGLVEHQRCASRWGDVPDTGPQLQILSEWRSEWGGARVGSTVTRTGLPSQGTHTPRQLGVDIRRQSPRLVV